MQVYIQRNGNLRGPLDLAAVQQGLDSGEILATDSVRFEGTMEWMPVSRLPGMRIPVPIVPAPIPPVESYPAARSLPHYAAGAGFEPSKIGCGPMLVAFIAVFLAYCLAYGVIMAIGGEVAANIALVSFSLASVGWVLFDAMALKTGRGQVVGMVNMSPWAWAFCFLLFWLIAFPIYLVTRPEIVKANQQYPDGPPLTDSIASKNNGCLIASVSCLITLLLALVIIAVLTVIGGRLSERNPELRSTTRVVR